MRLDAPRCGAGEVPAASGSGTMTIATRILGAGRPLRPRGDLVGPALTVLAGELLAAGLLRSGYGLFASLALALAWVLVVLGRRPMATASVGALRGLLRAGAKVKARAMTRETWRLGLRTSMVMVAVCAVGASAWRTWGPTARWRTAIRHHEADQSRAAIDDARFGRVPFLSEEQVVSELIVMLGEPDPRARLNAMQALAEFGPRARPAAPAIVRAIEDDDYRVRQTAIQLLLWTPISWPDARTRADALRAVVRSLDDPDPAVRIFAAQSLAEVGHGAAAMPVLIEALRSHDRGNQRKRALWTLGRMGPQAAGAVPALVELVMEEPGDDRMARDQRVRAAAILYRCGRREAVLPVLRSGLQEFDIVTRRVAEAALASGVPGHGLP